MTAAPGGAPVPRPAVLRRGYRGSVSARSLYRRHRPRTFADVVGQEHVVRTLRNAVEHRDVVQRALTALSPEEREAIALRFGAELTVPEIAEALREPLTTVEGRVYRALRKLRGELAE